MGLCAYVFLLQEIWVLELCAGAGGLAHMSEGSNDKVAIIHK